MKSNYCKIWKILIVLLIWANLCFKLAEGYGQTPSTEIRPSVNAQQFITAASGSNSLHTGQLSLNIPLFNLQSKGIDVPISISFNGGGVNHQSEASHIGLGWSLLAGGVITQTIRDKNDQQTTSRSNIPWQYDGNYIQNKFNEQSNSPYSVNKFDIAMTSVIGFDGEPDMFNYSFLGYSGNIAIIHNVDGTVSRTLYPDKSFKIENTIDGFKIRANDGNEYFFEIKELKSNAATSWFLTKIKTLQGGTVTFSYADDTSYDLTAPSPGNGYTPCFSKRLTRIDFDYGYLTFSSAAREDMYYNGGSLDARKITNIELYDKANVLIKGYQLGNNTYFNNDDQSSIAYMNKRLKLNDIREYSNGQYLPPYEFEYSYHFSLPKTSVRSWNFTGSPKNTWAHNPGTLASVDRDLNGSLLPWVQWTSVGTN